MEVVACFLQKFYSLLADKDVASVQDLYANDAFVSVSINDVTESNTGGSLIESIAPYFADGIVTINDVKQVSSEEAIAILAEGFVVVDDVSVSFTQKVTLASAAKHWYIIADQITVTVPEKEEEVVEEPEVVPEEVPVVVEKTPTPQRSPAVKPKSTGPAEVVETIPAVEKPKKADVPAAAPAPAPAAKPTSWAALALSKADDRLKVVVAAPATTVAPPKPAHVGVSNIYFPVQAHISPVASDRDAVTQEIYEKFQSFGISRSDVTSLRVIGGQDKKAFNVFVDLKIPDALEKLQNFNLFDHRISVTAQRK